MKLLALGCLLLALTPACNGDETAAPLPDAGASDAGAGGDTGSGDAGADGAGSADGASGSYTLSVTGGYGSGSYAAGALVHVWAKNDPATEILESWQGDTSLLQDKRDWHASFTMPARDVSLTAKITKVTLALSKGAVKGVQNSKPIRYHAPAAPRGLILLFHGTGGNAGFIEKTEPFNLVLRAVKRGYAVAAMDAEEVQAGDTDGNGKIRWQSDVSDPATNPDVQNVKLLLKWLVAQGHVSAGTPVFALGMSNGGAFSVSLGAVLPLGAAASYCASGLPAVAAVTKTPTAWLMCEQDHNPQVSNSKAKANHDALVARKIASSYWVHPPSPLYAQRFARIAGVDAQTSQAIAAELSAAKLVDAAGYLVKTADAITTAVQQAPAQFPALSGLNNAQKLDAQGQIKIMTADHRFYDDWAARTLDFFDAHGGASP